LLKDEVEKKNNFKKEPKKDQNQSMLTFETVTLVISPRLTLKKENPKNTKVKFSFNKMLMD